MSNYIYILSSKGELYHCDASAVSNDELYHWGVKGMKWGVRRYQNKDGSLTPAGKKRYREALAAKNPSNEQIGIQNEMYSRIRSSKDHARAIDVISNTSWMKREKYIEDVLNDPDSPLYKSTYKKTIKDLRAKGDSNDKRTDAQIEEDWNHHFWEEMSDRVAKHYYDKVAPGRSEKADYAEWKTAMDNYINTMSDKMLGNRPTWQFEGSMWDIILDDSMKQLRA